MTTISSPTHSKFLASKLVVFPAALLLTTALLGVAATWQNGVQELAVVAVQLFIAGFICAASEAGARLVAPDHKSASRVTAGILLRLMMALGAMVAAKVVWPEFSTAHAMYAVLFYLTIIAAEITTAYASAENLSQQTFSSTQSVG